MSVRAFQGSDGRVHAVVIDRQERSFIACADVGARDFIIEREALPRATAVTCVPCLAVAMGKYRARKKP